MNLTPREYEVARLFALGRTWEEIMAELGIRRGTVGEYRHRAIRKVDGDSLVDVWRAEGWLHVPSETERALTVIEIEAEQIIERLAELTAEAERLRDDMRAPGSDVRSIDSLQPAGFGSPVAGTADVIATKPAPSLRRVG